LYIVDQKPSSECIVEAREDKDFEPITESEKSVLQAVQLTVSHVDHFIGRRKSCPDIRSTQLPAENGDVVCKRADVADIGSSSPSRPSPRLVTPVKSALKHHHPPRQASFDSALSSISSSGDLSVVPPEPGPLKRERSVQFSSLPTKVHFITDEKKHQREEKDKANGSHEKRFSAISEHYKTTDTNYDSDADDEDHFDSHSSLVTVSVKRELRFGSKDDRHDSKDEHLGRTTTMRKEHAPFSDPVTQPLKAEKSAHAALDNNDSSVIRNPSSPVSVFKAVIGELTSPLDVAQRHKMNPILVRPPSTPSPMQEAPDRDASLRNKGKLTFKQKSRICFSHFMKEMTFIFCEDEQQYDPV